MANTTNLDLVKINGTDKPKLFTTPYNGNLDKIDDAVGKIRSFLVQVSNGNAHGALSQYDIVYVYNHSTLDEGFYIATSDIAANATLTSSNVSLSSGHKINALFDDIRSANSSLSQFENTMAIIADGDAHQAISQGQFVYVRFHNTLTPGLYTAKSDIALNAALTSSNLQADGGSGGLNALSTQMAKTIVTADVISLASYTAKTLIDMCVANGYKEYYVSATGSNKLSDLPKAQAGQYFVLCNTYYKKLYFTGTDHSQYEYDYDTNTWYSITDQMTYSGVTNVTTVRYGDGRVQLKYLNGANDQKVVTFNPSAKSVGMSHTTDGSTFANDFTIVDDKYQFTCLKNGGKLRLSSSDGASSIWMIVAARGVDSNNMGAWIAVMGSSSSCIKELVTTGNKVTCAFDSGSSKLQITNTDSNDLYVSVSRMYGTGTLTGTQA